MKKIFQALNAQRLLMLVFTVITTTLAAFAQTSENVIELLDFEGGVNRIVNVPISMANSDEVYAVQFEIELPFAMPQNGTPRPESRLTRNGHSVSVHSVTAATNTYRVVVYNSNNKAIAGNSGIILRLPMSTQDKGGESYRLKIKNVVLTDKKGNNIATNQTAECTYTVSREDLPDLEVADVTLTPASLSPGGKVTIGYLARNTGNGPTRSGWTEKYYLESVQTGQRCLLGNIAYTGTLAAAGSLQRRLEFTLPNAPHLDGEVRAYVEMIANHDTGELMVDDWNNSGYSNTTAMLGKKLLLTCDKTSVNEGRYYRNANSQWWTYDYITMKLTRTGNWSHSETFKVDCSIADLLRLDDNVLPQTVTIPAGSEGVTFRIYSVDDNIIRTNECSVIIPAAHGYNEIQQQLTRIDDDRDPLKLTVSATSIHEGDDLVITATRGGECVSDLTFDLTCSAAHRFTQPRTITIPAGKAVAQLTLKAIHDGTPQLDTDVRFSASPSLYQSASVSVRLLDDDRPAITAVATPSIVAENAGESASSLIVARDRGFDMPMKIKVTSSRSDVILKSATVIIPAGEKSIEIPISIIDNTDVDGERSAKLTAQLYVDGSGTYAPEGDRAYNTASLRVSDDEAPYLTLTSRVNTIAEGSAATITVHRYVASTASSLTVSLASSDAGVTVPQTVTIPSGSYTATFTANAVKNTTEGDERMVTLTAQASSIEPAALTMRVSDRTLPDAVCLSVDYDGNELYAGMPATLYAEVGNEGTATLPTGMRIDFYLATGSSLRQGVRSTHITTVYTERELSIGDVQKLKFTATIPEQVGTYWLYARVNGDNTIQEFTTNNNVSRLFRKVFVAAPFSVESISTDRESYLPGDLVTVMGRVSGQLNGQTIRVTLKGNGQHTYSDTRMGADGSFRTQVAIDRSAAGMMKVMGLALGQTDSPLSCDINVWNMTLTADKTYWQENVDYQRTGKLTLTNTSGKTINGIELTHSMLPNGCQLAFSNIPQSLAAGSSATISYTVTPTKSMTGNAANFMITAKCSQGVSANVQINYFCHATTGNISLSPQSISTTLLEDSYRQLSVKVTNYGLRATGPISVSIPSATSWLKSLSGRTLKSLAPGQSTTLHLQLTHNKSLVSNHSYASSVLLTAESGEPRLLSVTVRIVEKNPNPDDPTEIEPKVPSQIAVQTHDVFSKSGKGYDHLQGAVIKVTDTSGRSVTTGTADANGRWTATGLKPGVYFVEASATRHKTVRTQLVVGPSEELTTNLYLPYKAVLTNFIATTDMETGEYKLSADIDVDYSAPQAIVLPDLPDYDVLTCNDTVYAMTITNVGSRPAINMGLTLPKVPGVSLRQETQLPAILYPNESWVIDIAYSAPEERRQRNIAALLMKYGFNINGETFSEDDTYQVLMGCGDGTMQPEIIEPEDEPSDSSDYNPFKDVIDSLEVIPDDPHPCPEIPLPTSNCYMKLTFDDDASEVFAGHEAGALLEVKNRQEGQLDHLNFNPEILGYYTYEDSTDVFTVKEGEYTGFTKTAEGYTLAGNTTGTLRLYFTPKDEAAAKELNTYRVSGYLSYIDRQTKISNAASLTQTKMVVKQVGKIEVVVFMQQNFLADDPATAAVETQEPTELTVMVSNTGRANVTNVKVTASDPVVKSNVNGELLSYELVYSEQVDDHLRQAPSEVPFTEITIDTIAPGATSLRRFFYTTAETGHLNDSFTFGLSSTATQEGFRRPLSLIRTVKDMSHTTTHVDTANASDDEVLQPTDLDYKVSALAGADMFLVDMVDDANHTPDMIWPSDGTQEQKVEDVSDGTAISGSAGNFTLKVDANAKGWVYGRIHDPTNGKMILSKVVRQSDGMVMSAANFWQSDRSVQQDYSIIYENNLHFADSLRQDTESYQLTFVEKPDQLAQVMRIRIFTADETEIFNGETTTKPVTKALVYFTRPMSPMKKNRYEILVGNDPKKRIAFDNKLCTEVYYNEEKSIFFIDMSKLEEKPGLHSMRVWCERLRDLYGIQADPSSELTISWTENITVKAHLDIAVGPDVDAGNIDRETAEYDYGIVSLTATPAEGYRFVEWQEEGVTVSRTPTLKYDVMGAATLMAVFVPIDYDIQVDCNSERGTIMGFGSGIYSWGETLLLSAVPAEGYVFDSWLCDGEKVSEDAVTRISVNGNHTYTALFTEEVVDCIGNFQFSDIDDYWYTLQGICLGSSKPSKPGFYINQGKKVIIK